LPGHSSSQNIGLDFSFDDTAKAIINILNEENIPSPALFGYSMGGRIALFTAIKYQDRFSKLILESCTPGLSNSEDRKTRLEFEKKIIDKLEHLSMTDFITDWYNMPLFDSIRKHPKFNQLVKVRIKNNAASLTAVLKNLGSSVMPNLWENLSQLKLPIYFIYGDKDDKFKVIADGIQQSAKNVSLFKIKNSGHNTHFENPREFCIVLTSILNKKE